MIFLGATGGAVNLLWEPAQQWLAGAPRIVKTIELKVAAEHSVHGTPLVEFLSPSAAKRFNLAAGKRMVRRV